MVTSQKTKTNKVKKKKTEKTSKTTTTSGGKKIKTQNFPAQERKYIKQKSC